MGRESGRQSLVRRVGHLVAVQNVLGSNPDFFRPRPTGRSCYLVSVRSGIWTSVSAAASSGLEAPDLRLVGRRPGRRLQTPEDHHLVPRVPRGQVGSRF